MIFHPYFVFTSAGSAPPVIQGTPNVGNNNFWIKGNKSFPRPRYWWEKNPETIPDDIPLPDSLEQIQEEEQALASTITDLVRERAIDGSVRILRAYAEILEDQRLAKQASLKTLAKSVKKVYVSKHSLTEQSLVRKKKIMLLLN